MWLHLKFIECPTHLVSQIWGDAHNPSDQNWQFPSGQDKQCVTSFCPTKTGLLGMPCYKHVSCESFEHFPKCPEFRSLEIAPFMFGDFRSKISTRISGILWVLIRQCYGYVWHLCRTFCVKKWRLCSPPARWGLLDFIRAVLLLLILLLLLVLLRQLPHAVGTAGPQLPASDLTGHCWTSTAGFRSEWARLNLNRQVLSAVGTAGPQPPRSERSGHRWTSTAGFRASGHRWTST